RNIYALVRVADEIGDGVTSAAGRSPSEQADALHRYIEETHRAMRGGYSSDLVIHALARTARASAIDESLTQPFFDSMLPDLRQNSGEPALYDEQAHATYVHGSAEAVGRM